MFDKLKKLKVFLVLKISTVVIILATIIMFSTNYTNSENITQQDIKTISASEFKNFIKQNSGHDLVVLDIRTPEEYALGHIPNSVLMNYYDPSFTSDLDKLDKNKKYGIYCNSGNRSKSALSIMRQKGFIHVYELEGGIQAWIDSGYEIAV